MHSVFGIIREILFFYNEIAVYLVLGIVAGALFHVLFPDSLVRRHLGGDTLGSVTKATVFGIPIPLCSCGVIPVATALRGQGASRGSTVSFLIASPQVGADSFLVTWSLLGGVFASFRIIASLITAFLAGIVVNLFARNGKQPKARPPASGEDGSGWKERLREAPRYAVFDLLGSISNSLLAGVIVAGSIGAFLPDRFFELHASHPFWSMVMMMVVGIPLYVCATASTPIAASLVLKGLSPGAALVFLLTGPATNAVTVSTVIKVLGRRAAAVYLVSIALVALTLGTAMNVVAGSAVPLARGYVQQHEMVPGWLRFGGSVLLTALLAITYASRFLARKHPGENAPDVNLRRLRVCGMTCAHCAASVRQAVETVPGTEAVNVDVEGGWVAYRAEADVRVTSVRKAIEDAGFGVPPGE